ncbi:MAG: hypothetical protein IKD03_04805, partial [Clostridia bacterium]|nr:hypothetical protein [Clostridia bacterium]
MKKIFSKILLVLLSVVTAFSTVACDTSTGEKPKGSFSVTSEAMKETLHTIHEINVTPGTKDLVTNGKSDYKIVIPKNPTNEETTLGANEIQLFLGLATGAELEICYGDENRTKEHAIVYNMVALDCELGEELGYEGYKYDVTDGDLN